MYQIRFKYTCSSEQIAGKFKTKEDAEVYLKEEIYPSNINYAIIEYVQS